MFEQQWDFESGVAKTLSLTTQEGTNDCGEKKTFILNVKNIPPRWMGKRPNDEDTAGWKTSLKTCLHCISR